MKVVEGMSPEFHVPCGIHCMNRLIFILQPYVERFLTVITVAFCTVFIVDVPVGNVWIISIAFYEFGGECFGIFLVYKGIWAGVVTLTEVVLSAFVIRTHDLRVFLNHPRWKSSG